MDELKNELDVCGKPDTCIFDVQPVALIYLEMHVPATVMGRGYFFSDDV